jgi:hypothetical protein
VSIGSSRSYEGKRLALQAALDAEKTRQERNAQGQFATPTGLAQAILTYATSLLPQREKVRFFDPGIGTGSFYSALRATASEERIAIAQGFEIDPHYSRPAVNLWSNTKLRIIEQDFTKAQPPASEEERFNLLICNPPYVRHHHIVNGEKVRLQKAAEQASGVGIGGLSGLYCYFLALSHTWMSEGGVAAWLIPSEFMDVNYGRALKRYLLTKVNLLRIHRFDPNDVQFADALVSSAIVFFRKELPPTDYAVEFTFGGAVSEPKVSRSVSARHLEQEDKWTRFPVADIRARHNGVTLGDLFRIKRGLATGDNKFFMLRPDQIKAKGLPHEFFKPILPSPRYLTTDHIKADSKGCPAIEHQMFLLDCRLPEADVKAGYPVLWDYLQTGRPNVADRYLCRHRKPWYSQEDRPPAPFICTYLGRSDKKSGRPFRFIFNESQATAANVYLLLYPKPLLANALAHDPLTAHRLWEFLSDITPEDMLGEGRVYGGGLHKMEPKELSNVPADSIAGLIDIPSDHLAKQADMFEKRAAADLQVA